MDVVRLCDIAPGSFIPNYTAKFEGQTKFIPGISGFLRAFLPFSSDHDPDMRKGSEQSSSTGVSETDGAHQSILDLEKDLWMTVITGLRHHKHARKLPPLWSSEKGGNSGSTAETRHYTDHGAGLQDQDLLCEISDLALNNQSSHDDGDDGDEEDLVDFTDIIDVWTKCSTRYTPLVISDGLSRGYHGCDVEMTALGPTTANSNNFPCDGDDSGDAHGRNRGRTSSMSQQSDVSMLMPLEGPVEEARIIRLTGVIGQPCELTQNVLRMHPLRQHEQGVSLVRQGDSNKSGRSLYERDDLGWSEESLSSGDLLESQVFGPQHTTHEAGSTSSSPSHICERSSTAELLRNAQDYSPVSVNCARTSTHISTRQNASIPTNTLADLLGNDHLLWHMWKRRGSVRPRGEDDFHEMRAMYETDPDMKLLGTGWNIDPSNISPGSTNESMLHDTMQKPSPHEKHMQPASPTSERRSYFSQRQSTSSSSVGGQSNSDSKFQRRSSILKRLSWGGRVQTAAEVDMTDFGGRTVEVKRRKTLDDYDMTERETMNDDSDDMLF
ncbi:hypothetical protein A1O1_03570 [Capronia coronata CBS 617.96]|uniref:Uncharacterized protein n=1 Tax=Capronia coronata CBS 617.96 TaxID=1182541 RepID=W9YC74_9EURO|nr:uncharacterized protein A1O1_03570 [Capronia coronata CBS 617.96]EXJ90467.1 hypothetical protein A1O1_03570 [Capronia coronata CBS 617.96]